MNALIEHNLEQITTFCQANGIRSLSLFGSQLHDQAGPESDVDLLVEFEPDRHTGLFEFTRLEIELGELLNKKVDLRTCNDLSRYFRQQVLEEAQPLYGRT